MMSGRRPQALPHVVAFRAEFCSPAYLNSLLRLQHLHWLEIRHSGGADSAIAAFVFVIPASLSNLVCVLGTEVPLLESKLGCRVRQVPMPSYVAPDSLKAFSVDYAERPGSAAAAPAGTSSHAKFLSALRSICVRVQLTNICLDTAAYLSGVGGGGGGRRSAAGACQACAKVRTHTKSVRGASSVRPRLHRQLPVTTKPAQAPAAPVRPPRRRRHRPASIGAAPAGDSVANTKTETASAAVVAATAAAAVATAIESMSAAASSLILHHLSAVEAATATDAAALSATAALKVLSICICLDLSSTSVVADALAAAGCLQARVVGVFAEWAVELANRLLDGCARLVADSLVVSVVHAVVVADAVAVDLLADLADRVAAEMAEASQQQAVTPISNQPCDWRTSSLGLQSLQRRCPNCDACIIAEPAGASGYHLLVRPRSGKRS